MVYIQLPLHYAKLQTLSETNVPTENLNLLILKEMPVYKEPELEQDDMEKVSDKMQEVQLSPASLSGINLVQENLIILEKLLFYKDFLTA